MCIFWHLHLRNGPKSVSKKLYNIDPLSASQANCESTLHHGELLTSLSVLGPRVVRSLGVLLLLLLQDRLRVLVGLRRQGRRGALGRGALGPAQAHEVVPGDRVAVLVDVLRGGEGGAGARAARRGDLHRRERRSHFLEVVQVQLAGNLK